MTLLLVLLGILFLGLLWYGTGRARRRRRALLLERGVRSPGRAMRVRWSGRDRIAVRFDHDGRRWEAVVVRADPRAARHLAGRAVAIHLPGRSADALVSFEGDPRIYRAIRRRAT